ncbi:hypothetical protein C163_13020 [Pseudomonas sp. FGI182]|nr:hypothetical protein C163_13020 [Pseudomonas sp. FGI182]
MGIPLNIDVKTTLVWKAQCARQFMEREASSMLEVAITLFNT